MLDNRTKVIVTKFGGAVPGTVLKYLKDINKYLIRVDDESGMYVLSEEEYLSKQEDVRPE